MPIAKIAIIGECMVEISGQPFSAMQQNFGGDTINSAIYLKQILAEQGLVSYITAMGTDGLSKAIVEKWQEYGVDTQFVLENPQKHAGLYLIQNDQSGERTFQYWRNDAAAKYLLQHPDVERIFSALEQYPAVYLSGISLAILPAEDRESLLQKLQDLQRKEVKIIFDSNYRANLWSSIEETQICYQQLYEMVDLALLTFDDEQLVWGDESVAACRARLEQYGIAELVIKDGANGCFYTQNGNTEHFPTRLVETIVDTTAAGDSFNAGYLAGWLQGKSPNICGQYGNRLAGQVIQKKGAVVPVDLTLLTE